MGQLTPAELNTLAARRPREKHFDEVYAAVLPLVNKYARRYVQGFDEDDLRQEMLVVLFKCHATYNRRRGSFLNLFIMSMNNTMGKLKARARRNQPIAGLRCHECGGVISRRARGPECDACGGHKWDSVRLAWGNLSLESILLSETPGGDHGDSRYKQKMRFLGEEDPAYDGVDLTDAVQRVLADSPELQEIAARTLSDVGLNRAEKKLMRTAFADVVRV